MDAEKKLTIFDLLKLIDQKKVAAIDQEGVAKAFVPFLTNRWLTGSEDGPQIFITNEVVNPYVFNLHKHKSLLWKLMCCATSGKPQRYQWKKRQAKSHQKEAIKLVSEYNQCTEREAITYVELLSKDDIMEIATFLGRDKDEINKLKKELD